MAKIATAHIEIKPVLNEEALQEVLARIEEMVTAGVQRALDEGAQRVISQYGDAAGRSPAEIVDILSRARGEGA